MTLATVTSENRFVTATDWDGYNRFLEAVGERRIRVTYDGTMVELMTPSHRHESLKSLLGMLLECLMQEWEIDFEPGGNTTFKAALKKTGLEPDECYWITHCEQLLGGWDPDTDPPPDLAIEVEVSTSVLDRISIYAALGVPELWRVSSEGEISIWKLDREQYVQAQDSLSVPGLPLELLNQHLCQAGEVVSSRVVRAFRQALRA